MVSREEAIAWAKPLLTHGGLPAYISDQTGTKVAFTYTGPSLALVGPLQYYVMGDRRPRANLSTISDITQVYDDIVPELTWHHIAVPAKPILIKLERQPTRGSRLISGIVVAPDDLWPLQQPNLARLHIASEGYLDRKTVKRILRQYRPWQDALAGVRLAVFLLTKSPHDPEGALRRIGRQSEDSERFSSMLPSHLQEVAAREPAGRAKILEVAMTTLARRSH